MAEAFRATVRARFTRLVVILAIGASVLVVAFGTGYRASHAVLDDGSAYLVKGTSVTHVNAETGRSDADVARELAKGDARLQVVQTPSGHVYVVGEDGSTTTLNTGEMAPGAVRPGTAGNVDVLGSGATTYYVDRGRGTVSLIDPDSLAVRRTVPLTDGVDAAVATTSGGTLWVLSGGRLLRIVDGAVAATTSVGDGDQQLTIVGGRPVLVDHGGVVRVVEGDKARTIDAGLPAGTPLEVNQPGVTGSTVWVADEQAGDLIGLDVRTGDTTRTGLGSGDHADLGPAVTLADKVYVPDYSGHVVRVVSAGDGKLERTIPVTGTSTTFDLFVEDGRVWINDPAARTARVLDGTGRSKVVDKGPGHGVKDPGEERTPSQPPVAQQPPAVTADPGAEPDKGAGDAPGRPNPGNDKPAHDPKPKPGAGKNDAPAPVDVPDTVGQSKNDACTTLKAAGLGCSQQGVGTQQGVPPDQVISSSPAAGKKVAAGTIVTVQYAGAITVPDLTGRSPDQACSELLTPAGLGCDPKTRGAAGDNDPVNLVTAQDPAPGSQVGGGGSVSYDYFELFHVADFADRPPAEVCPSLAKRPITCSVEDMGAGPRGSKQNVVVEQTLAAGDYPAGRTIVVRFYSAENGGPMPNVVGYGAADPCDPIRAQGYNDCAVVESATPARNPGVLAQSEPPGSVVRSGKHIEVARESETAAEVCLFRKPNTADVWLIRIGCNKSGIENWDQRPSLGFAYVDGVGAQPGTRQLFDNMCSCGGQQGQNHLITPDGFNGAPWAGNGTVGRMFVQDFGGMQEIGRFRRNDTDGSVDYAYGIRGNEPYSGLGFTWEQSLGWVWAQ